MKYKMKNARIAVIGLGYVGLPLAVEFGKKYSVVGFDINEQRIQQLREGIDATLEVDGSELEQAVNLSFSAQFDDLKECNIYIVTVPTPIDAHSRPDLSPILRASEMVGALLSKGDIVVYESTVYPGATEDDCIPVLEKQSGFSYNTDFYAAYSPERINPGDKQHRLTNIKKVTSGSTPEVGKFVDDLYASIIKAGTHMASSIKVAEAAKVIENTQRDLNIALMNELSLIFDRIGIDTLDVLEAAGTKWNFLPFRPGLVGGHCIGVDPYYLTHKAQELGYFPEVVLSGRRINENMGNYVAQQLIKRMINIGISIKNSKILIMGLAFKEDCPDLRNTRVIDIVEELETYGVNVDIYDPWIEGEAAKKEYGVSIVKELRTGEYPGIVLAVPHSDFREMSIEEIRDLGTEKHVFCDLKGVFPAHLSDFRL